MISLDFYTAVAGYFIALLTVVIAIWVYSKKEKEKILSLDPRFIWYCSLCTYTYINTKEETISTCPRCGSYNKKQASTQFTE